MSNPILLAICAAILYGFGGPFMKYAHQSGVSTRDFIFIASLTTLVVAIFWPANTSLFASISTGKVLAAVLIGSMLITGGFTLLNQALSSELGLASVILVITSANPLIGSLISLFYLGESKKVILPMLIIGSLLIVCGTIAVVLSSKNN